MTNQEGHSWRQEDREKFAPDTFRVEDQMVCLLFVCFSK